MELKDKLVLWQKFEINTKGLENLYGTENVA